VCKIVAGMYEGEGEAPRSIRAHVSLIATMLPNVLTFCANRLLRKRGRVHCVDRFTPENKGFPPTSRPRNRTLKTSRAPLPKTLTFPEPRRA
jgi:hypothetical protein